MQPALQVRHQRITALIDVEATPAHDPHGNTRKDRGRCTDQVGGRQKEVNNCRPACPHQPEQMSADAQRLRQASENRRPRKLGRRYDDIHALALHLVPQDAVASQAVDRDRPAQFDQRGRERREMTLGASDLERADHKQNFGAGGTGARYIAGGATHLALRGLPVSDVFANRRTRANTHSALTATPPYRRPESLRCSD